MKLRSIRKCFTPIAAVLAALLLTGCKPPELGDDAAIEHSENQMLLGDFSADYNGPGNLRYSLSGQDADSFQVDADGMISFVEAPDFESGRTEYSLTLEVHIGPVSDAQQLTISITNLIDGEWQLTWSDEFDGDAIDMGNWQYERNCWGGGNNEQQCYTDRPENSYVEDGYLHIVAREETFRGPATNDDDPGYDPNDTSREMPFTSARLRSKDRVDFTYGRVEVRAKLPAGQGMWPAIWMLPTDWVYGLWPASGEIDIVEAVNLGVWPNEIHGTTHYGLPWPQWTPKDATIASDVSFSDEFHIYAIEWEADELRWFVDGIHYHTQRSDGWYNYIWQGQDKGFGVANPRAPFDERFHMIMNVAVGGSWPGDADRGWAEPRKMLVDYVRVFQCSEDLEFGTGCKSAADPIDETLAVNTDNGAPLIREHVIFADGLETVTLPVGTGTVDNPLSLNNWQLEDGNLMVQIEDLGGERGQVIRANWQGLANFFIGSADMSEVPGADSAFVLNGNYAWRNVGDITFDLMVRDIAEDTGLVVKLDSGFPNLGSKAIDIPPVGEWTTVTVKAEDLFANPQPGGSGIDVNSVLNLFVLETTGSHRAEILVDNISLSCAVSSSPKEWQLDQVCNLGAKEALPVVTEEAVIFDEAITDWNIGVCCGGAEAEILEDDVPSHGLVVEFRYSTDTTVTFFQSIPAQDFTALAGGTVSFDLKVLEQPDNAAWIMKTDCGFPCGSGDVPLTDSLEGVAPTIGVWQTYTFPLDNLVARGLDLRFLDTPLVIFPSWGNQNGARFRVDNIKISPPAP